MIGGRRMGRQCSSPGEEQHTRSQTTGTEGVSDGSAEGEGEREKRGEDKGKGREEEHVRRRVAASSGRPHCRSSEADGLPCDHRGRTITAYTNSQGISTEAVI